MYAPIGVVEQRLGLQQIIAPVLVTRVGGSHGKTAPEQALRIADEADFRTSFSDLTFESDLSAHTFAFTPTAVSANDLERSVAWIEANALRASTSGGGETVDRSSVRLFSEPFARRALIRDWKETR